MNVQISTERKLPNNDIIGTILTLFNYLCQFWFQLPSTHGSLCNKQSYWLILTRLKNCRNQNSIPQKLKVDKMTAQICQRIKDQI